MNDTASRANPATSGGIAPCFLPYKMQPPPIVPHKREAYRKGPSSIP